MRIIAKWFKIGGIYTWKEIELKRREFKYIGMVIQTCNQII